MEDIPVAWMRRWAFEKIDVMKIKKADRPRGWMMHDCTVARLYENDVPLYAKEPRP